MTTQPKPVVTLEETGTWLEEDGQFNKAALVRAADRVAAGGDARA